MVKISSFGYSLVELVVVLGVLGLVTIMAFWGMKSFNNSQLVPNAQKELLSTMRSLQTQAYNGARGLNNQYIRFQDNQNTYSVWDNSDVLIRTVTLPAKISLQSVPAQTGWTRLDICFSNPNLSSFTGSGTYKCSGCTTAGSYYACRQTLGIYYPVSTPVTIRLTDGTSNKDIKIDGSGTMINRIY